MGYVLQSVHRIHIECELLTSGFFPVSVAPELPIEGVGLLMGNGIAGGKVTQSLEVLNSVLFHSTGRRCAVSSRWPGTTAASAVTPLHCGQPAD